MQKSWPTSLEWKTHTNDC